ncbi:MAG: uracil-DNA glycosylase [Flavobacteriaceae bacterium]|nr:uracil-DNA glycosylase [Flavobacteriaceae bacterium]
MEITIENSWKEVLSEEFKKSYFKNLTDFVKKEYATHQCFPKGSEIFAAFNACPFSDVKVVIIGQDPYHGQNQANGLCFSVHDGIPHPPSLINIFKEITVDMGVSYPKSGDLTRWAEQGVLLLNATLTVRAHEAGSHQQKGWEIFTDEVIKIISAQKHHVVFMLWGGFAKNKIRLIDTNKHCILSTGHPSPLSANRGYWFGNQHFSKANLYLERNGIKKINW